MAAPTVGAVMADILPYLGVPHSYTDEDAAGRTVVLQDMTGMTRKETQVLLKEQGLTALMEGDGETVTAQIPAVGQGVPGNSQVILYFGDIPAERSVTVPDFTGMTRQQANDAAGALGLYILVTGNTDMLPSVVVTSQSKPENSVVPVGTTIQLKFTDTGAAD